MYMQHFLQEAYSVDVGGKLAGEDEAVNALLQAWDFHYLHEIAFDSAQLLRVAYALVLRVLTLHHTHVRKFAYRTFSPIFESAGPSRAPKTAFVNEVHE